MPRIKYESYIERVDARIKYFSIIQDMNEHQLKFALKALVDGEQLEEAMDLAMATYKFTEK